MTSEHVADISPGKELAAARRAQGKTLAQIAAATRILESRLEAIERDDYDAAGSAPAFIVGYIRAFAKQVNVEEQHLIDALSDYFLVHETAVQKEALIIQKTSSSIHWTPWIATILAVVVFVGLGQWFINKEQNEKPASPVKALDVVSPEVERAQTVLASRASNSERGDLPSDTGASESSLPPLAIAGNEPEQMRQAESVASTSDVIAAEGAEVESQADNIRLAFTDDCWVEVKDANGQVLASQLAIAGSVLMFDAKAPFDVKMGNFAVVNLQVNGREIALTPIPGRRVLRLQVGP